MLVLTRRVDESIAIDDGITITILAIEGDRVKLGIQAPKDVKILRQEIYLALKEQDELQARLAAESATPEAFEDLRKLLSEEAPPEDDQPEER